MTNNFSRLLIEGQFEKGKAIIDDIIKKLKGKTIIVFDTETTALDPKRDFNMITELAAQAYDDKGKILDTYHKKALLTNNVKSRIEHEKLMQEKIKFAKEWDEGVTYHKDDVVTYGSYEFGKFKGQTQSWVCITDSKGVVPNKSKDNHWRLIDPGKKTIEDLLKMTAYNEQNTEFIDVRDVLLDFKKWVESFKSPLLVAHNARFDMYQVNKGLELIDKKYKLKTETLDTLALSKNYLIPMMTKLANDGNQNAIKGLEVLKAGSKKPKSNLGVLGKLFKIETKHWHSGIADVEQLAGILFELVKYLKG